MIKCTCGLTFDSPCQHASHKLHFKETYNEEHRLACTGCGEKIGLLKQEFDGEIIKSGDGLPISVYCKKCAALLQKSMKFKDEYRDQEV